LIETMNLQASSAPRSVCLVDRIQHSALYQSYQRAFHLATGLPLSLLDASGNEDLLDQEFRSQNGFCKLLQQSAGGCAGCAAAHQGLVCGSTGATCPRSCPAGLVETAVAIRSGGHVVAHLKTGQIRLDSDPVTSWRDVRRSLPAAACGQDNLEDLEQAWRETRSVSPEQYEGIIALLAAFAAQLSDLAARIALEQQEAEPATVRRAKQFIQAHLGETLTLEAVAAHAGVSPFYFCKIFKQSTLMTFTEFVNRRRVEKAKRLLRQPYARITEAAFDSGFQSLSQFNRSFLRYAGESPTHYRSRVRVTTHTLAA
jgi:AraC-like DNA-binding protein/ligand-binding sensor protein